MRDRALGYSLAYLITDDAGALHVVDPGTGSDSNELLLTDMVRSLGFRVHDIASITLTHYHPDHAGLANRLREATDALVALHAADVIAEHDIRRPEQRRSWARRYGRWGVPMEARAQLLETVSQRGARPALAVDLEIADGDVLPISGRRIVVVHLPGHSPGSIALRDDDLKLVMIGDHVLPTIYPAIGLGAAASSNPVRDYLRSLEKVAALDDHEVLPGHEETFRGLARRCVATAEHHLRRTREIASYASEPARTPWEMAQRLSWKGGWDSLTGMRLASALQQVVFHSRYLATAEGRDAVASGL
ncbi:MBL fold metallo-hydrolase [Subtercola sp. RTI3]|nr:MBL fold metallo-hydrolase [Subtercola sp. RTI3]